MKKTRAKNDLTHRFQGIVGFLSDLENPEFNPGEFVGSQEDPNEPGVLTFPYARLSNTAGAFVQAAYDAGLVLTDFDWPTWARTTRARKLRTDAQAVERATPQSLARLLTACIRADRFVEGSLLSDFQSGLILRIVRRAAALLAEERRA